MIPKPDLVALPIVGFIALAFAGCNSPASTTSIAIASPKPTPTAPSYRDVTASFRMIAINVDNVGECERIERDKHVAVIAIDAHVPKDFREAGAAGAQCWRGVHPGDSKYAGSVPAVVFAPHHRVGTDVRIDLKGAPREASSVNACAAAARPVHVAALAYSEVSTWHNRAETYIRCFRPIATDDSAADETTKFVVRIPAREVTIR